MCSQLQTTSVNNFPSVYPHANRSHDAWKWASKSSLILTRTLPLIDSLFVLEVQRDVRYSFAVRKGMLSLWCLVLVPVSVSASAALASHFLHQTWLLDWNSAATRCSSAVQKHKHEKAGSHFHTDQCDFRCGSRWNWGGVCMCQRPWPCPLKEHLPNVTFFFFSHRRVRNARRAAFRWQCQQGNMNSAKKQEILVTTCSIGSVYSSKITTIINTETTHTFSCFVVDTKATFLTGSTVQFCSVQHSTFPNSIVKRDPSHWRFGHPSMHTGGFINAPCPPRQKDSTQSRFHSWLRVTGVSKRGWQEKGAPPVLLSWNAA